MYGLMLAGGKNWQKFSPGENFWLYGNYIYIYCQCVIYTLYIIIITFPSSTMFVSMTMVAVCCSQTILQKSSTVCSSGPWVAMYSCSLW